MESNNKAMTAQQRIAVLNVGGECFSLLRSTIQKFPKSHLATLLEEFPELGTVHNPIFVDRHPKSFPWIMEIYRDGEYEHCMPEMSESSLIRELEFYNMPPLRELRVGWILTRDQQVENLQRRMIERFNEKIKELDLSSAFPIHVWFYRKFNGRRLGNQEEVAIKYEFSGQDENGVEKDHDDFFRNVVKGTAIKSGKRWLMVQHRLTKEVYGIRQFDDSHAYSKLPEIAAEYGLRVMKGSTATQYTSTTLIVDT